MDKLRKVTKCVFGAVGALAVPGIAFADTFVTGTTIDTAPVLELAGIIVSAIGGIWAVRKVI